MVRQMVRWAYKLSFLVRTTWIFRTTLPSIASATPLFARSPYCLYKFFQYLGLPTNVFNLLKSKEKLARQDEIFRNIVCNELNWEWIPS